MILQTRYLYILRYVLPIADILTLNLVYFLWLYGLEFTSVSAGIDFLRRDLVVCNLVWLFAALYFGLYAAHEYGRLEQIYRCTWRTVVMHALLFVAYLFLQHDLKSLGISMLILYALLSFAFILSRFIGTAIQFLLIHKFNASKRVAVMGGNATGARLADYLKGQRNIDFYGFIRDNNKDGLFNDDEFHLDELALVEMQLAATEGVEDLYVAVPPDRMAKMHTLIHEADKYCLRLKFVPDIAGALAAPYQISYMGGEFPIITLREEPMELMSNRFKKRAFDLVFSSLVIVFVLTWLFPVIALLIKLESKGPVLFRQLRSGRNDEPFWCFKFRSMRLNTDSERKQAVRGDDRITAIGAFLRKTSLDEMPQFLNVFLGSMSVVGPRPHMLSHTEAYKAVIDQFMVRHFMKPGITGWAQVNGCRGETKEDGAMEERVKHDVWYLENWTGMLDVKIIFMTIINMFKGDTNAF
ncbi:undecaprenyl-phosphate glucose phosphotransferase [Pedobacter sp. MC2016-24]|uniref:undecaprenyl-phosphate glucose phosphotransferase n=1 Tax=Pedobacter sp. MC2016-24 TaxID=2780090 RepID=UPI0018821913|nr:undecaprenyl-phosphate glucose phosphotransferase [Pedobacter sp. MC2016-24]MBE9599594.1 undecaprenyl-phosphate glucose phosphotransferase [Pedobacter sp. MC2016-24]